MDSGQTRDLIEFIAFTFSKAVPNSTKLDFYHNELWQLDGEALEFIKKHFRGLDSCPSNIVKAVKAAHSEWTGMRPEDSRQSQCQTCNSYGLLIGQEHDPDDGQLYSYVFRCPNCENWRSHCGEGTPVAQLGSGRYMYKQNGSPYNPQRKAA